MSDADIGANRTLVIVVGGVIFGFILVALLALLLNSTSAPTGPAGIDYNGFDFFQLSEQPRLWVTTAYNAQGQSYELSSYYAPFELEDVPTNRTARLSLVSKPWVFFSLDSELDASNAGSIGAVAAIEVGKIVGTRYGILNKPTLTGVTVPPIDSEVPRISCDNVTSQIAVVFFTLGHQTSVELVDECIIVMGTSPTDLVRAADRFMFSLVGIMDR